MTGTPHLDVSCGLNQHFGHRDMGIYAEIITPGTLAPGGAVGVQPL